jgi:hypothetical protein
MNKVLLYICIALLFVSCASSNKVRHLNAKTVHNKKPAWINNPDYGNNIGVVSIVSKNKIKNKDKRLYIAKLKAKALFSERKNLKIDSELKKTSSTLQKKKMSIISKQSSTYTIDKKLVVKAIYEDKENLYLWMVVKR